ncbi:MAG: hypothetical protein ABSG67_13030, partial [Thermoguttaceae bacterium]
HGFQPLFTQKALFHSYKKRGQQYETGYFVRNTRRGDLHRLCLTEFDAVRKISFGSNQFASPGGAGRGRRQIDHAGVVKFTRRIKL